MAASSLLAGLRSVISPEAGRQLVQGEDSVEEPAYAGWCGPLRFDPGQQRLRPQRTDSPHQRRRASMHCRTWLGAGEHLGHRRDVLEPSHSSKKLPIGSIWPSRGSAEMQERAVTGPSTSGTARLRTPNLHPSEAGPPTSDPSRSPSRSHRAQVGNQVGHICQKSVTKSVTR